jgi:hypothetical protein
VDRLDLTAWSEEAVAPVLTSRNAEREVYETMDVQKGSLDGFELVVSALEVDILDAVIAVRIVVQRSEMVHLGDLCSRDDRLLSRVSYASACGQVYAVGQR